MSNKVRGEIIYITYRKYKQELDKMWISDKKLIGWRNWLLILNAGGALLVLLLSFFNMFGKGDQKVVSICLVTEIVILIAGAVVIFKADKIIYSDKVLAYKVKALHKVIPEDKYDEIIDVITIKSQITVLGTIKKILFKVVTIVSLGWGIIVPTLEQIKGPLSKKILELSNNNTHLLWGSGLGIILALVGILLLGIGIICLISVYERLLMLFCWSTYAKSCELITTSKLAKLGLVQAQATHQTVTTTDSTLDET